MKPGVYKHTKTGKLYRVHFVAKHSETLEDMVMYEALYENQTSRFWVRPPSLFIGQVKVGTTIQSRFSFVKD